MLMKLTQGKYYTSTNEKHAFTLICELRFPSINYIKSSAADYIVNPTKAN